MDYAPITKPPVDQVRVRPNLDDYAGQRASWSWDAVKRGAGRPGGGRYQ